MASVQASFSNRSHIALKRSGAIYLFNLTCPSHYHEKSHFPNLCCLLFTGEAEFLRAPKEPLVSFWSHLFIEGVFRKTRTKEQILLLPSQRFRVHV